MKSRLLIMMIAAATLLSCTSTKDNTLAYFKDLSAAPSGTLPNPQGNYFCFVFDEEVQLSTKINLLEIISSKKSSTDYIDGMPIFLTGEELMKYKK